MITLFTTLKPSDNGGRIDVIQYNALMSWSYLPAEIMVFGDETGTKELVEEVSLRSAYNKRPATFASVQEHRGVNEFGTPLIEPMFRHASDVAQYDILGYVNGDIILKPSFTLAVKLSSVINKFLMVGRRINLEVKEKLDFEGDWRLELDAMIDNDAYAAVGAAIDYFVHTRYLWDNIPPELAIARYYWDNHLTWLVGTELRLPVIDATGVTLAVHQSHGQPIGFDSPEGLKNRDVVAYRMAGVEHSTHHLNSDGAVAPGAYNG